MLRSHWPQKDDKNISYSTHVHFIFNLFLIYISNTNFLIDVFSLVSDICKVFDNRLVAALHLQTLNLQMLTHVL